MSRVINFFIMIYLISFIFASSSKKKGTDNRLWKAIRGKKYNNGKISSSPLSQQTCLAANNSDPNQQKADSLDATNSGLPTQSKKTQEHKVYTVTPSDTTKVGDNTFFLKKTDKEPTNNNEKDMSQSASLNYEQELVPHLRNRYREICDDKKENSQESEQNNGQELVPHLRNRYRKTSNDKKENSQESEQNNGQKLVPNSGLVHQEVSDDKKENSQESKQNNEQELVHQETSDDKKENSQESEQNNGQELVPYLRNRYRKTSDDKKENSQESEQNNGQKLVPNSGLVHQETSDDKEKDSQESQQNNEQELVHQETSDDKKENSQESEQSGESTNETVDRLVTSTKQDGYRLSGRLPHPYKISFNRRVLSNRIAAFLQLIKRRKDRLPTK
ncbi:hypothetical protein VCUG_01607 [Vavraia culicis subsp. floridensis]|uniref:Uncharacterized protein n=1 Tax=Vavraia culicis (isolate floridensis) TaxID=948595 RepID=L2GTH4_VAVCU|nr:uncharacterized protein VCUG_01607 [Vavraia culicis subsp. floridensis]ELA46909.1 hypothetical protein VCUG_01607 [Vavraia culicis subsp. floridensis]